VDLLGVGSGEAHVRGYVGLGALHERGELGELHAQLIGDRAPLRTRRLRSVLGEDGVDHGQHHLPLALARVRQRIAQEVHFAALPDPSYTTPGDVSVARDSDVKITKDVLPKIERRLSWTRAMLNFKGETVAEAAAEFNRYDTTKIVVADPSIEDFRIGGAFLATNPESFVAALQKLFAIDAEKRSGSVDLYLSRRKSLASQD
jgi:hypothetical protein